MAAAHGIDYVGLWRSLSPDAGAFSETVVATWLRQYQASTPWASMVLEIELGSLTYLFDAAPSYEPQDRTGDDRVVGVFGRPTVPQGARDHGRQAGFIPDRRRWSELGYDRGHFVAHSLGGGLDINLFPQAVALNRGWSIAGRRWRDLERRAAAGSETLLFVRPCYDSPTWTPRSLDVAVLANGEIEAGFFDNSLDQPTASE